MKFLLVLLCACLLAGCIPLAIGAGGAWWCAKNGWPCGKSHEALMQDCWQIRQCLWYGARDLPQSSWSRDALIEAEQNCTAEGL